MKCPDNVYNLNISENDDNIIQVDGNGTIASDNTEDETLNESNDQTEYNTDDEAFNDPVPVKLYQPSHIPVSPDPGHPIQLDVDLHQEMKSPLPLCIMFNARSLQNKADNLAELLAQICPDILLISESWESERRRLSSLLRRTQYKSTSYFRKNKAPGGGCAILYNEKRFAVTLLDLQIPDGVEGVWALFSPNSSNDVNMKVKRIAAGSFYISPKSRHKSETIEHIIQSIHTLRAQFGNEIHFLIGGDFNKCDISDILDSYGAMKQIVSVSTRKSAILEIILTDLHTMFHPPTTIPPLQVDKDKIGKDSDHNIVVFAPKDNAQFKQIRKKKKVFTRPMPESQIANFEKELLCYPWEDESFTKKSVDEQTEFFHTFIRNKLDEYFPEKMVKISSLDKIWMSPSLKHINRCMKREFYKHRKSQKYTELKAKFKKMKRKAVKSFYSTFVSDLKMTDPSKWYKMAKRIGALDQMGTDDIKVGSLMNLNNKDSCEKIAEHFAKISNEYSPINLSNLPAYLPALPAPQVSEYEVYQRIKRIKKSKSTLPIDIPDRLWQECAPNLAGPICAIINKALIQSVYPCLWKQEWVTAAPKITNPETIQDLRKIACTSDYSKVFEGFLKDWIMEDVSQNIDIGQFGGQSGIGTEHMIVCYVDRILYLLDNYPDKSAVIATSLDWAAAFDRQDPTIAIQKFLKLGVRASLIPLLVSYLTDRKMRVKFNGEISKLWSLIGGGPQGTLIGGIEYIAQSNDNADVVPPLDRF